MATSQWRRFIMGRTTVNAEDFYRMAILCTAWVLGPLAPALGDLTDPIPDDPQSVHAPRTINDQDAAEARRTDWLAGVPATDGALPNLLVAHIGRFSPDSPSTDLYTGAYHREGLFLRVDLTFEGLVNPPGAITDGFDPRAHGTVPVSGYVGFDVDRNVDTGGDWQAPEFYYNGNVARYGGHPTGTAFDNRISTTGLDSDGLYNTSPWFDRSGEDFHLAIFAENIVAIQDLTADGTEDGDSLFEFGETWILEGFFFRRASGYDLFSFADAYDPLVQLRYAHDPGRDYTTITLVYPMTNAAHALLAGEPTPQDDDHDDTNAYSIHEALLDLVVSAGAQLVPGHEFEGIILPWVGQDVDSLMDPRAWRPTFLVSTVLLDIAPLDGGVYTFTDIWPNVVHGDFNGDGLASNTDAALAAGFVADYDGDPAYDVIDTPDGQVEILDFGIRFSIFDVNYDGVVGTFDLEFSLQELGDYNNDTAIDLEDFAALQRCFAADQLDATDIRRIGCFDAFDTDGDNDIDLDDVAVLLPLISGPQATGQ